MDILLRAAVVYLGIFLLMRVRGKRQFNQLEAFDFVLLLIIAEASQQALLGDDFSVTNGLLVIAALIAIDEVLQMLQKRSSALRRVVAGAPTLLVEHGRMIRERVEQEGIEEDDILQSARQTQGVERLEQIKFAVLERNGSISVIPAP